MTPNSRAAADALHNSTKHGTPPARPERLVQYRRLDPANAPSPFKRYRDLPISPLPRTVVPSELSAVDVLSGVRGEVRELDSSLLATLLFLTAGVNRTTTSLGRRRTYFRTAMSAGNLHPIEVYVVVGESVDGVQTGVHHFAPHEFGLTELRSGDFFSALSITAPLVLVFTGLVWRTTWKYGERGWRHLYWDTGTMLANLLAVANTHGIDTRIRVGFDDAAVSNLVGIDGVDEVPVAVVALGQQNEGIETQPTPPEPISPDVEPVSPHPIRLPLLVGAQTGSVLTDDDVDDWLSGAREASSEALDHIDPPPNHAPETIEAVISERGSTRAMKRVTVPADAMWWPLAASTLAVPLDAAPRGTFLDHFVNVHAVAGEDAGAFSWEGNGPSLIAKHDSARAIGARLCLDQALGGDSAYTVFHHACLDRILETLGARGYRAAQLEAGVVSGRLALCAFALGLGATGLTFYDDLVSSYFQTTSAPMLATAVGVPTSAPAPSGSPGEPAVLRR